jgi:hypothetical protein
VEWNHGSFWIKVFFHGSLGDGIEGRAIVRVVVRGGFHDLIGKEVSAGTLGHVVLGCGDEELAGGVEGVGVPACGEHALSEDEIDVLAFADAE